MNTEAKSKKLLPSAMAAKYFIDNFSLELLIGKIEPTHKNEALALIYFNKFMEVLAVFDRLIRYEKYFKEFFPPEKSDISEPEAIEYHLRSYLQDFYILQERVRKIKNSLINDIQHYNIANEKDWIKALEHLSNKVHENFKNITSNLRRKHVHVESVSELGLVTGKTLNFLIKGNIHIPDDIMLDQEKIKQKYNDTVISMRNKHIKQSSKNSENLKKMKEWFAVRFIYIFSSLNGHAIKDLDLSNE